MGRNVEEIQTEIRAGAERLDALLQALELSKLQEELEAQLPDDTEPMWLDDASPCVAYEIHGDLAHLAEHLRNASEIMWLSVSRTPESSIHAWRQRRLESVADDSTRSLLRHLLDEVSNPAPARD